MTFESMVERANEVSAKLKANPDLALEQELRCLMAEKGDAVNDLIERAEKIVGIKRTEEILNDPDPLYQKLRSIPQPPELPPNREVNDCVSTGPIVGVVFGIVLLAILSAM